MLANLRYSFSEQLSPSAFQNSHSLPLPVLQCSQRNTQPGSIFRSGHPQRTTHLPDLPSLIVIEEQIIFVQQFCNWYAKHLCNLFHFVQRIVVSAVFFIVDVGRAINSCVLCNLSLQKCFPVSVPPELVSSFSNLGRVRKTNIEFFCFHQMMWSQQRKGQQKHRSVLRTFLRVTSHYV